MLFGENLASFLYNGPANRAKLKSTGAASRQKGEQVDACGCAAACRGKKEGGFRLTRLFFLDVEEGGRFAR